MRRWNKQPEKPGVKATIDRRQLVLGCVTLLAMAALLAVGLTPRRAAAPQAEPDAAQVRSDSAVTLDAACQVVQHLTYTPCGHSLTRRLALPQELVGKGRAEAEAAYDPYRIVSFSADELVMEQTLDMYCPDHVVLMPDESGMLCVFENRYGDALALVHELSTPLSALPESYQEELLPGMGFDTLDALESWLEAMES